eukprot:249691-Pyramimonas_sp.AAC.1
MRHGLVWHTLEQVWYGQSVWSQLLSHRVSPVRLRCLSASERREMLYARDEAARFHKDDEIDAYMAGWKQALADIGPAK